MTLRPGVRALHVAVLACFAFAQPTFDVLSRHVQVLVAHAAGPTELMWLAVVWAWVLPGSLALAALALQRLAGSAAWPLHLATVGALMAVITSPVLQRTGAPATGVAVGALVAGSLAAAGYGRWSFLRRFVSVLAPVLVIFPVWFLARPPVSTLFAGAEAVGAEGFAGAGAQGRTPVILVLFDGLPLSSLIDTNGNIRASLYPNFSALAESSRWYRNATTVAERTHYAVPALLTGALPLWKRPATAADYPQNLFTLLADSHELHVFETQTRLCPERLCAGRATSGFEGLRRLFADTATVTLHVLLPAAWTASLPAVSENWKDFAVTARAGEGDPEVFEHFLAEVRRGAPPGVHFVHLGVPHSPYRYLPSGREYRRIGALASAPGREHPADEPWARVQALQLHLLQVRYADRLLGRLLAHLRETGLESETLLVVTSDHGISFDNPVSRREVTPDSGNAADVLAIPLFVRVPGEAGGRVIDRNVETVDVLPIILDVVKGRAPEPIDGRSLLDESVPARPVKTITIEGGGRLPRERGRREFPARIPSHTRTPKWIDELFDLDARDPFFRVGPHRAWLGRSPEALPRGTDSPFHVTITDDAEFERVDLDSGFVPARVAGSVESPTLGEERLELAVALNGVVWALARTYQHAGNRAYFSAMLPESAFRDGANRAEVFVVDTSGSEPRLLSTRSR
jgi:hypothetical protein